ncbi:MAG TPA: protein kinase [Candidatus Eisenbacteria bacterium]|nr:protein kinase [Candidatus Eisenbacteria bacterium]
MVGRKIGRFHVLAELGRGGMGTVWKARDELLGRVVAIKVLGESLASDAAARRDFRREAEIAALLDHPSIVPVYEAGESDDVAYMVMKLIHGETFERYASRRLPPQADILRIALSVTEALGYAHARDVIHRDITPRNIMLTQEGDAFVLDFGLARVTGATASTTGHVKGTLAYLAPERVGMRPADARSDIYGLGVVLYKTLTGVLPFDGENNEVICYRILAGEFEPPRRLRPSLDPCFEDLILRMMARDPERRPPSAEALAIELRRLAGAIRDVPSTEDGPKPGPPGETASDDLTRPVERPAAPGLGRVPAFLAVLPIEAAEDGPVDPGRQRVLQELADAARARLANIERLHVVAMTSAPDPSEDARSLARRVGANMLLRSTARFEGTAVRLGFALIDAERGVQVGGGNVDGSVLERFELEDRWIAALREALSIPGAPLSTERSARPRDPAARERFAQALAYLGRFDNEASIDGAISILESLLTTEGETAEVQAALARACVHKYNQTRQRVWEARAAKACDRAKRLDADSPDVLLAVGEFHAAAGRYAEALVELDRALGSRPEFYEAHVARARALDGAGRAVEAEAACRNAIAIRPADWRGYHVLGLVLFRVGRYEDAVEPWEKVTQLTPDNAAGHRNLGSAMFHLIRYDDCLVAFRRSNEIHPHGMAFDNLGTALFYLGRYDESIEAFEKAVVLTPAEPRAWGNLGNACRRVPGREPRMREALERAVALMRERFDREPGEGQDWARLAGWLANLDRRKDAEQALLYAVTRSPEDVYCMVAAGLTLLRLGEREEAKSWIRRAVQHGYSMESVRRSPDLRALAEDAEFRRILEDGSHGGDAGFTRETE